VEEASDTTVERRKQICFILFQAAREYRHKSAVNDLFNHRTTANKNLLIRLLQSL